MQNPRRPPRDYPYRYHTRKTVSRKNTATSAKKTLERQPQAQENPDPVPGCSYGGISGMHVDQHSTEDMAAQECVAGETIGMLDPAAQPDEMAPNTETAQIELEPHVSYAIELARSKSVVCVSPDSTVFLLQDIAANKLVPLKYLILERRKMTFQGACRWVYMCTCNRARSNYTKGLSGIQEHSYEQVFSVGYEDCIHLKALSHFMHNSENEVVTIADDDVGDAEQWDHDYSTGPGNKWAVYRVHNDVNTLCVKAVNGSYGVVYIHDSGRKEGKSLRCLNCPKPTECRHVGTVMAMMLDDDEDVEYLEMAGEIRKALNKPRQFKKHSQPISISTEKIPLLEDSKRPACLEQIIQEKGYRLAPPRFPLCPLCSGPMEHDAKHSDVKLYTERDVLSVQVSIHQCQNEDCGYTLQYDGLEDRILNMGSYLMAHKVLRAYLRLFVTDGLTMFSYYKTWFWSIREHIGGTLTMSVGMFRYAWYAFLELLDVPYKDAFMCPSCSYEPPCIIMDGITLSFQHVQMPWEVFLEAQIKAPTSLQGTSHNVRVFVNNQEARKLLQRYSNPNDPKFLKREEFERLVELIALYQPALTAFIQDCCEKGYIRKAPAMCRRLVYALASNSPVTALFNNPGEVKSLTSDLCEFDLAQNSIIIRKMQENCPAIFSLITKTGLPLPPIFRPIVEEVEAKCRSIMIAQHNLPTSDVGEQDSLTYFPNNDVRSLRGTYVHDSSKLMQEMDGSCEKTRSLKRRTGHKSLLPGLFTMNCQHGITYGFKVMADSESPNVPFTLLRTRFTKGPKLVVYDNACNLHQYCLNRDPGFFRETKFAVDRLHWKNHKGCSEGYNLSAYPQYEKINSQVAEQRNSALVKLKPMLSYMTASNFIEFHESSETVFVFSEHVGIVSAGGRGEY